MHRTALALLAVVCLSAVAAQAAVTKTCLTGTAPAVANDASQIRAVRILVDAACVCSSFDGSKGKTHGDYVKCAAGVINRQIPGALRKQCGGTVKKFYAKSACGMKSALHAAPCIQKNGKTGKISCSIKPTTKTDGSPTHACSNTKSSTRVSCSSYSACIDAADSNGDLIVAAPGDSGACVTLGACSPLGSVCAAPGDCCSGVCTTGVCEYPACTSDNQACSADAACCSGTCTGGACAPLNASCRTLGNACVQSSDCCSQLCQGGTCSVSSFCGQNGDVCTAASDCCSGTCGIAAGATVGTCTPLVTGATCAGTDGTVCAGADTCGAGCCSGLCATYGPTGVPICQPASGCHAVGDVCTHDTDCCGAAGLPGGSGTPVVCNITPPATIGFCTNPSGCKPDGDLCKLATTSCNRSCDCCSGNCLNVDTCIADLTGVARCAASTCVSAGGACASSANCCNNLPCVPNPSGTPPFVCLASSCAAAGQACTIDADCCTGATCVGALGSTQGTCTQ